MNKDTLLSSSLSTSTLRAEALFFERFAQLIASDVPLLRAIEIASEEISDLALKKIIHEIKLFLEQGESISDAFRRYPKHFSKFAVAIIDSGEREGRLEDNFNKLAESLRREIENRKAIIPITHGLGTTVPLSSSPINETMLNNLATRFASSFIDAFEELAHKNKPQHKNILVVNPNDLCPKCRNKISSKITKPKATGLKRTKKK
ncbi:MAG: type II secretion system F family protein [bacterium]